MHHHLAASGDFGQSLARRLKPITVANKQGMKKEKVHVVGPLCTPLDSFGFVDIPQVEEGDLIAVLNSGAYGFSASPLRFLSHEPPKELIVQSIG
jgi:diaminopimelate decarboxylase